MSVTVGIHPDEFEIRFFDKRPGDARPFVSLEAREGDGTVTVYLVSAAQCDDLIKAAVEAKRLLLGDDLPPALEQDLAAAETDPANPYSSSKHGEFTATSAAAVAEDVDASHLAPTGHLPQHKGGHPECTLCNQPGHHLHAIEVPTRGLK